MNSYVQIMMQLQIIVRHVRVKIYTKMTYETPSVIVATCVNGWNEL